MSCKRTLTMGTSLPGDYPVDSAVYHAGTDAIFGTSGAHVVKFNATTGEVEQHVPITDAELGAILGPMCICTWNSILMVSTWQDTVRNQYTPTVYQEGKGLTEFDPATMLFGTNHVIMFGLSYPIWLKGPRDILQINDRIIIRFYESSDYGRNFVIGYNLGDDTYQQGQFVDGLRLQQFDIEGAGYILYPIVDSGELYAVKYDDDNDYFYSDDYDGANNPVHGVVYCPVNDRVYGFGPSSKLVSVDNAVFTTITNTDLAETMEPTHVRYRASDQCLYFVCQRENAVLVWKTMTDVKTWKTGFESPHDIIFTAADKAWVLQHAPTGLKELV